MVSLDPYTSPFIVRAFIGVLLTSLVASSVGPTLVSRGITFLAEEAAHAALGGAALGVLLASLGVLPGADPLAFAFLFGVVSGLVTAFVGERGELGRMESAIGVSLAMSMSLAVLFLGMIRSEFMPRVWGYLIGDLLLLSDWDLALLGVATALTVLPYLMFHKEYMYIAFDMEGVQAMGLRVKLYHYLSIVSSAVGVVVATKALGAILIYAFVIAPAATAGELAGDTRSLTLITLALVLASGMVGVTASFTVNLPPSGIIGLITSSAYLATVLYRRVKNVG